MTKILRNLVGVALITWLASPAFAGPSHRFVAFGDSLSDPGNAFILTRDLEIPPFASLIPSAPYARGFFHFSNGPTWIEQLSLIDHALPSAGPALLLPVLLSNYAVGGARARQGRSGIDRTPARNSRGAAGVARRRRPAAAARRRRHRRRSERAGGLGARDRLGIVTWPRKMNARSERCIR